MEITFKAGVLIIGSLYWDNTNGRRPWREQSFGEHYQAHQLSVAVPIRYGRFSDSRDCPTMTFSTSYNHDKKFGTAIFCPFKNQDLTAKELMCQAAMLSEAEGANSRSLIKGSTKNPWCVLVYLVSPSLKKDNEKWNSFLNHWNYERNLADVHPLFRCNCEDEPIFKNTGELSIEWPEDLGDYDLILATQTRPTDYLPVKSMASQFFKKPEYFLKNRINGIFTDDDTEIIKELSQLITADKKGFAKNAIANSCSMLEIEIFIKKHLLT